MDETHASHTYVKVWGKNTDEGLKQPVSKVQRLIIAKC